MSLSRSRIASFSSVALVVPLLGSCRATSTAYIRGPQGEESISTGEDQPLIQGSSLMDKWDLALSAVSVGVVDVDKTVGEEFRGTKAVISARHAFVRSLDESSDAERRAETLKYLVDGHLEVGDSDSDLQYGVVAFTYSADQETTLLDEVGKVRAVRDQLELGTVLASFDDTLGVEYYYEIRAARLGRFWSYRPTTEFPVTFTLGTSGSIGWAWVWGSNGRRQVGARE